MLDRGRPRICAVVEDRQLASKNGPEVGSILMNSMNALERLSGGDDGSGNKVCAIRPAKKPARRVTLVLILAAGGSAAMQILVCVKRSIISKTH